MQQQVNTWQASLGTLWTKAVDSTDTHKKNTVFLSSAQCEEVLTSSVRVDAYDAKRSVLSKAAEPQDL
jgi:hypothetical protein